MKVLCINTCGKWHYCIVAVSAYQRLLTDGVAGDKLTRAAYVFCSLTLVLAASADKAKAQHSGQGMSCTRPWPGCAGIGLPNNHQQHAEAASERLIVLRLHWQGVSVVSMRMRMQLGQHPQRSNNVYEAPRACGNANGGSMC